MELSQLEWRKAQEILVKLARTDLVDLENTQKEIAELIERLPKEKNGKLQKDASSQHLPSQARLAIQSLITEENLARPKAILLRAALQRVKPLVDQMVDQMQEI